DTFGTLTAFAPLSLTLSTSGSQVPETTLFVKTESQRPGKLSILNTSTWSRSSRMENTEAVLLVVCWKRLWLLCLKELRSLLPNGRLFLLNVKR
ncbi:UNVERIFIED_CONTAM: hypothetical protein HDU68_012470, partial [Siphonaria sp. JEL0065]